MNLPTLLDEASKESYVILDYQKPDQHPKNLGVVSYPASQHPVVSKVLSGKGMEPRKTMQEIYRDSATGEDYYIDYIPIFDEGKAVALLSLWYDWSSFNSQLLRHLMDSVIIGFVVLLILNGILVYFLYHSAILPLNKVKTAVTDYMDRKDSQEVEQEISRIRVRNEIGVLGESFTKLTKEIDRYTDEILELNEEKTRAEAELNVAASIQINMLPRVFPPFPERHDFEIYATMDPAREVGGDFYDFFLIDDNHIGLVIADVSGKGVPAAIFMATAKTMIKNRTLIGGTPAEIMEDVNNQLNEGNNEGFFVTVWFAIVDLSTGKAAVVNAGHEHPVLHRNGGTYELVVYSHSPVVAVMENIIFDQHSFQLNPGDTLFVYTDGVAEATNSSHELYGTGRLVDVLNQNPDADLKTLLANVRKDIDRFVGDAPQFDDITMMGFTFHGPSGQNNLN